MLKVCNVNKTYNVNSEKIRALNNINIIFTPDSLTFVLGKSGSGKTTLLNILAGLDIPDSGSVVYDGTEITDVKDKDLDEYRNLDVGIIFQDYNLIESLNVYDNIAIALEIQDSFSKEEIKKRVEQVLEYVDLSGMEKRKITELSGGQAQRVAIARALIKNPKVILADEPTGNLDNKTGIQIIKLLKKISHDCTVIVITHDEIMAKEYGDTIIKIQDGSILSVDNALGNNNTYTMSYMFDGHEFTENGLLPSDISRKIHEFIGNVKNIEIKINLENISPEENNHEKTIHSNTDKKVRKLSFTRILMFALNNITKKPVRSFFVILLFGLSLFFLMITLHVSRFNAKTVIKDYLEKYEIKVLYLQKDVGYTNSFYEDKENTLTSGKYINNLINSIEGISEFGISNKLELSIPESENEEIYYDMPTEINFVFDNGLLYNNDDLLIGRMPEKANEILITDYIADAISSDAKTVIGKDILVSGIKVKISGIIKTDYIGYNFKYKDKFGVDAAYTEYHKQRDYAVIVLKKDFLELLKEQKDIIILSIGNFTMPDNDSNFTIYPDVYYCGTEDLKNSGLKLWAGRMPENENEVIVSDYFYDKYIREYSTVNELVTEDNAFAQYSDFMEKEYLLADIYDEKYNNYYTSEINMYDYIKRVKVVGVFSSYENGIASNADVAVNQSIYDKLVNDYCDNMIFSEYGVILQNISCYDFVKTIDTYGIKINEPSIYQIYSFSDALISMRPVLQVLLIVAMAITVLVLFSYVSFSINISSRQIGIIRSIGISKADTINIFIFETLIITFVALILSYILDFALMKYINYLYIKGLPENVYNIIVPNVILCLCIPVFTILISAVSSFLPINLLGKSKPIDIIRSSKE